MASSVQDSRIGIGPASAALLSSSQFPRLHAAWLLWPAALALATWTAAFILIRSTQPYPLDAFEEYELAKAIHWYQGGTLYGPPEIEPYPEAYPPLYFCLLGIWQHWFGAAFGPQRALSVLALAACLAAGVWSYRPADRHNAGLIFVTSFLSLHGCCARSFEVGKPDMLLTFFIGLAIATGRHRTCAEVAICSIAILLGALTKQNAPVFLLPLVAWHFLNGNRRWSLIWGFTMLTMILGSYLAIDRVAQGSFRYWVFTWTAGHGVSFGSGLSRLFQSLFDRGWLILILTAVAVAALRRSLLALCLAASIVVALLGLSKAGGRENHLLPLALTASLAAGEWFIGFWASTGKQVARRANWARWLVVAGWLIAMLPGIPVRRDFRWLRHRTEETESWTAAVRAMGGGVAVSHHKLLAEQAGADCFFSDLILEFPGLQVPAAVRRTIAETHSSHLILCDDPDRSTTVEWSELIDQYYTPAGRLAFADRSGLLPDRVYRRRPEPAPAPVAGR